MKLSIYLRNHGLSINDFAGKLGVCHATVSRYLTGQRRPEWPLMQKIERLTGGQVVAQDFYDPDPPKRSRADLKAAS